MDKPNWIDILIDTLEVIPRDENNADDVRMARDLTTVLRHYMKTDYGRRRKLEHVLNQCLEEAKRDMLMRWPAP